VYLAVKPGAIRAHTAEPPGGGTRGTIDLQLYYGNRWEYLIHIKDEKIRMRCDAGIVLPAGTEVWLTFDAGALTALGDEASETVQEMETRG
jgi:hypothetical protein